MSQPVAAPQGAFLESLIRFLMPFFLGTAVDPDAARTEILRTLAAYAARTRAEMLAAAQIIAFSMTTLDVLAEAKANTELTPNQKIRFRSCANGLSRATQQTEKALEARLMADPPKAAPAREPINDAAAADVQSILMGTSTRLAAERVNLHPPAAPAAGPDLTPRENQQLWDHAMLYALRQMRAKDSKPPAG